MKNLFLPIDVGIAAAHLWVLPWSEFKKGAFPGSSLVVFGRPARDPVGPDQVPSIFSLREGPGLLLILKSNPGPG